jgi:hypothetical protein
MNFITIKNSLISLLGAAEAGRYRTIGFQQQGQSAIENLDNDRSVQVFYSSGLFPKSGGSRRGATRHNITYRVEMTVSKATEGDVSVLENPSSTPAQRATALAAFQDAAALADSSLDDLIDIVYQIIMDARNRDVGLSTPVADTWINQIQKDNPLPRGEYVVLTGSMDFTCAINEDVLGDPGTQAGNIIDVEMELDTDDVGKGGTQTGAAT